MKNSIMSIVSSIYLDDIKDKTIEQVSRQVNILTRRKVKQQYGTKLEQGKILFTNTKLLQIGNMVEVELNKVLKIEEVTKEYNNISFFLINYDKLSKEIIKIKIDNFQDEACFIKLNISNNDRNIIIDQNMQYRSK